MLKNSYKHYTHVCGTDEVGRGTLAGPVVAAAVVMPNGFYHEHLKDSKKMTEKRRNLLYDIIKREAVSYAVSVVDNHMIDRINILKASLHAMDTSIRGLDTLPDFLLVDGNQFLPNYHIPYETVIKGDNTYTCISAAAVLAKVHRDRLMEEMHLLYPHYDWCSNKGYGTAKHIAAIREHGPSSLHRMSFLGNII
jgi:ribonuclease HII